MFVDLPSCSWRGSFTLGLDSVKLLYFNFAETKSNSQDAQTQNCILGFDKTLTAQLRSGLNETDWTSVEPGFKLGNPPIDEASNTQTDFYFTMDNS